MENYKVDKPAILWPAEWYPQSAVQLTWPHEYTDWKPILNEVIPCFVLIAREIMKREKLLIVCCDEQEVRAQLGEIDESRVIFYTCPSNDSWARDHGGISTFFSGKPVVLDFQFNGWGLKYAANYDNQITGLLVDNYVFAKQVVCANRLSVVLEGGSVDTDGQGTVLTTASCLYAPNRNDFLGGSELNDVFTEDMGVKQQLILQHGYLAGDDTDGHIDTLARFCDPETIAYVSCADEQDEHYLELKLMEDELRAFRTLDGKPYRLLALPMAPKVEWEGERLPATYANFLILNGAVLLPFYQSETDAQAKKILESAFPNREVIGINCLPLIKQHGSLHCVTMQYPQGFID